MGGEGVSQAVGTQSGHPRTPSIESKSFGKSYLAPSIPAKSQKEGVLSWTRRKQRPSILQVAGENAKESIPQRLQAVLTPLSATHPQAGRIMLDVLQVEFQELSPAQARPVEEFESRADPSA